MGEQYRRTPRARFLDYEEGMYFVTICTKDRVHYFGRICEDMMCLSEIGEFLSTQLQKATDYCCDVEVPLFVVMPNHLHAMVLVKNHREEHYVKGQRDFLKVRTPNPLQRPYETCQRHVPTLCRYVNSLKGAVTKFAKANDMQFGWQPRFHDHLIRDNHECELITDYIQNNVARWAKDCFNM